MKNYFFKILVCAALLIALHVAIVLTVRSPIPGSYPVRQLIAVKRSQLATLPSPRIIFLGGSNVLMGIDANQVTDALKIPAYNFGLQAGLRLSDILQEATRGARAGDIVVVALEPVYYEEERAWDQGQLRNALAWDRPTFDGLPLGQRLRTIGESSTPMLSTDLVLAAILQRVKPASVKDRLAVARGSDEAIVKALAATPAPDQFGYTATNIDARGDMLHTQDDHVHFWGEGTPLTSPSTITPHTQKLLADFLTEMKARGVRVFFAHSPYIVDGAAPDDWKKAEDTFQAAIHNLGGEILDRREALFYPRADFFDTHLHLDAQGRELRTRMLIEALRDKVNAPPSF